MSLFQWLKHVWKGDKILIDFHMDIPRQRYHPNLKFATISEAQAFGMGYVRGYKMLDEFKYIPFKTYVRFHPDEAPTTPYEIVDKEIVSNYETASTLYDHFATDAVAKFLSGMTTKKTLAPIDVKKLAMIGCIIAAAAAGILLIMM